MYMTSESEHEYRNGDNGPKYLMKGPRSSFGVVQLMPGDAMAAHLHNKMEESFFVLEGNPTFVIGGETIVATAGDFINVEPGEGHQIANESDAPCRFVINTSPFFEEGDKVLI